MEFADLYPFVMAMIIGALIGIERQKRIVEDKTRGVAGLRTFVLIALLGALAASLSEIFGDLFIVAAYAGFLIFVGIGYATASRIMGWLDFTSAVAAAVTFLLGALCCFEERMLLAVALSILVTWTLATRKTAHRYVEAISDTELLDTLKMGLVALVILPLLPDRALDPLEVLNPRRIWMMVVLVSLISYVGYILIRVLGDDRGLTLTGILGGIVSSTAVTMSMASEVRARSQSLASAVFATTLASCTMFPRILLIVMLVNMELLLPLSAQLAAMAGVGVVLAYALRKNAAPIESRVAHKDPFRLIPALKFGALFAFILFVTKLASISLGDTGSYAAGVISGLADVDAVVLAMATLASGSISSETAVIAIMLAAITNTALKLSIAFVMGSREFGMEMAKVFIPMMAAGILTLFWYVDALHHLSQLL
ncbi:MAG TPA: MgtC/SapB family protein [Methanothrix sp.]|nr:MgtC/SapB family protein [Methanothrix sp.]HOK57958.1 MgtC/SapB family protein [Methanothrix sp.]HOL43361.1 MgtC/SapB family protein [Methanothrix sp.]HPO88364.1 MgtC/SapB family protein [Methanothrix sp.]